MLRNREHNYLLTPSKPRTRSGKDRRRCKTDHVLKRYNCLNTLSCTVYFYEHHLAHVWTKISNTSCTPAYADSHSSNEASQSSLERQRETADCTEVGYRIRIILTDSSISYCHSIEISGVYFSHQPAWETTTTTIVGQSTEQVHSN